MYLFSERPTDHQYTEETTLLEKLNYCSCFMSEANADDGLPQYICMSCSILIENAYQLKILCAKTEAKLHEHQQLSAVQENLKSEQLKQNIPIEQIDPTEQIDANYFNEVIEHTTHGNKDEKHVNTNLTLINTELQEDIDLIEIDDTNARDQNSTKEVEPHAKIKAKSSVVNRRTKSAYQCEKCCKWFGVKTSLVIHMRSHTNERPYDCEVEFFFHSSQLLANNVKQKSY